MEKFLIRVYLDSPLLMGSGIGWGALIDSDIVFDYYGLPLIPARRFKGLLRESATEVQEMQRASNPLESIDDLFGTPERESRLIINNLYPGGYEEYQQLCQWIEWFKGSEKSRHLFTVENILNALTSIRQSTEIDVNTGTAKKNSLRTNRVLNMNNEIIQYFEGNCHVIESNDADIELLSKAVANLRRIGSHRNRGMGKVRCSLINDAGEDLLSLI